MPEVVEEEVAKKKAEQASVIQSLICLKSNRVEELTSTLFFASEVTVQASVQCQTKHIVEGQMPLAGFQSGLP